MRGETSNSPPPRAVGCSDLSEYKEEANFPCGRLGENRGRGPACQIGKNYGITQRQLGSGAVAGGDQNTMEDQFPGLGNGLLELGTWDADGGVPEQLQSTSPYYNFLGPQLPAGE